MDITINGRIFQVLTPKTGVSKTGSDWMTQDFVIETETGEHICFNIFGEDKIRESGLKVGATASVTCKLESKEWNGKWFTTLRCFRCIVQGDAKVTQPMQSPQAKAQAEPPQPLKQTSADDLPF